MAWKAFSTEKVIEAIGPYAVEIEKLLFLNVCVLLDVFMGFAILAARSETSRNFQDVDRTSNCEIGLDLG